ncbi:NupC/NupG family nucleoside CNT transporter [Staphylococcus massiliensis]|uniref:Pyrimidine nucleoside transport protein n=1 Tax=Staphylococcus massiliensis S46 TaxID=1229783 RepID=K9AXY6_9STAP|nr:NupC/NupG family nucleoside CNT transporter [Staphylococcus massiliensis]EKU47392.1 pyrimidine nucleoside transport protein [Staphylococcus massiliensis S46]MCG3400310.1 NupC/NupG family nucleoside CNT transporter [Staphylococcus massiliensis]PNZ99138.1 NupC/NupG family nucleoside CNT transporter [Staphylococcus massiliensis CCUG 55927]
MHILIGFIGIIIFLALAYLISSDKKNIKWKYIGIMFLLQFIFAFLLLKTKFGITIIGGIAAGFAYLLKQAAEGVNFVFGGFEFVKPDQPPFFFNVLLPIVFISALIGILQYTKILPFIINWLGFIISKINGMGRLESYNAVAAAILGQSEVFISLKQQLPHINKKRLYTLTASAMSTVSASIIGAYFTMVEPKYVVTAIVLNLFGGFIIASIINPYDVNEEDDKLLIQEDKKQSFFEMLGEYILDGFKVAVIVGAMLIGYIALIALLNGIVGGIMHFVSGGQLDWNFQTLIGFVFAPFAFLTGIPWEDAVKSGSIMATKLLSNEFVAMLNLGEAKGLSDRATGIVSVFLVSFANFSSIGIISGAIKSLNDEKGDIVARFGLKLLFGATLVSFISATIAGFFM